MQRGAQNARLDLGVTSVSVRAMKCQKAFKNNGLGHWGGGLLGDPSGPCGREKRSHAACRSYRFAPEHSHAAWGSFCVLRNVRHAAWRSLFCRRSASMQRGARFVILDIPFEVPRCIKSGHQKSYQTTAFLVILKMKGGTGCGYPKNKIFQIHWKN